MSPRALVGAAALTAAAAATSRPGPANGVELGQVAGTGCHGFPANSYWHADISRLPVHPRSR